MLSGARSERHGLPLEVVSRTLSEEAKMWASSGCPGNGRAAALTWKTFCPGWDGWFLGLDWRTALLGCKSQVLGKFFGSASGRSGKGAWFRMLGVDLRGHQAWHWEGTA